MSVLYDRSIGGSAFLLAGLLLITGCGSGGSTVGGTAAPAATKEAAPAPKSAADVKALLTHNGLLCLNYQTVPKDQRGIMQLGDPVEYAKCDLDDEDIIIQVWKDEGQMENWEGALKNMGCSLGKQFGVVNLDYVKGNLWTIDSLTQTLANKIGAETGATPIHIKCA